MSKIITRTLIGKLFENREGKRVECMKVLKSDELNKLQLVWRHGLVLTTEYLGNIKREFLSR